ncbi:hypothetical protein [Aestuariivirga sp.]|uniref:hypothetical protein n=1 Tax=Aestuariivirga sp. TaxID=2650926 RepID=UPI0039E68033
MTRARRLSRSSDPDARVLGKWLDAATKEALLPMSVASSVYMRTARRNLLGALMARLEKDGWQESSIVAVTIIHPKWYFRAGALHEADPRNIKKQLQNSLERFGVTAEEGIFWAALDGEFDGDGYQLHFHGIATGPKANLIRCMSGRVGFTSTSTIQRPIECSNVSDLRGWLSYSLKSYWIERRRYLNSHGKPRRTSKRALGTPQTQEVLMWLAAQHLESLMIHSGLGSNPWGA